jgi:anthranilate phosphoribosyltransferase
MLEATKALKEGKSLSSEEMSFVFEKVFKSDVADSDISDFLIALHEKGETADEIFGAAKFLRDHGKTVQLALDDVLDCCGTGGSGKSVFNISTAVAFILAACGCHVAKHGNRAVTSKSGSADVLEALGVNLDLTAEQNASLVKEVGLGFFYAPHHYPFIRRVMPVRKSIPHRTIFNLLGPLINPAHANFQVLGTPHKQFVPIMAEVLQKLGSKAVVVVSSEDGLDEFTLTSKAHVSILRDGKITSEIFDPFEATGYKLCELKEIQGSTPEENALRLKKSLKGHSEPLDHTIHINAAWGLLISGKADTFLDALLMVQDVISSGRAYEKLEEFCAKTNEMAA